MALTFIEIIYLVLYAIAAIGRAPYAIKVKKLKVIKSKDNLIEYLLLIPVSLMLLMPLFQIFTNWLVDYDIVIPLHIKIIGLIGFGFAVYLHNWSHVILGTNWSPVLEIKEKHTLVTSGPYKYVRHPIYSAFLLWTIVQSIVLANILVFSVGVSSFLLLYVVRISKEEQLMINQFGKKYIAYMHKTPRLFPKFR